jgi:hypothetical protein
VLEPRRDVRVQAVKSGGMCEQEPIGQQRRWGQGTDATRVDLAAAVSPCITWGQLGSADRLTRKRPRGVNSSSVEPVAQVGQSGRGAACRTTAAAGHHGPW